MLKLTCLVLLLAVAVTWSQVDAKPSPMRPGGKAIAWKRAVSHRGAPLDYKREVSSDELEKEVDQLSDESQQKLAKELLAALFLSVVDLDNSTEADRLTLEIKKAMDKNWDNIDDYATELFKIYEEVTGKKLDLAEGLE